MSRVGHWTDIGVITYQYSSILNLELDGINAQDIPKIR